MFKFNGYIKNSFEWIVPETAMALSLAQLHDFGINLLLLIFQLNTLIMLNME